MHEWLAHISLAGRHLSGGVFRQQKGDVELDYPGHWVIMLFDALSKALHDPLVWLLAVVAVAIIIYRGYRKYRRS